MQCKVGEALVGKLEEGPNKEEKAAIIWLSKDSWPDESEEGHQIEPIEGGGWSKLSINTGESYRGMKIDSLR